MRTFHFSVAALVIVSALGLAGCGGGGSSSSPQNQNPLIGTYKTASLQTASGQQIGCPGSFTLAPTVFLSCGPSDTGTFGPDGKLSIFDSQNNQTFADTYTVSGDMVTVNVPASGADAAFSTTYQFSLSGTQLTLKQISSTSPDPTLGSDYNGTVSIDQKQ